MTDLQRVELSILLNDIEKNEDDRGIRNLLVYKAVTLAMEMGYVAGYAFSALSSTSVIACIVLPGDIGAVSWCLPEVPVMTDPHNGAERIKRCKAFSKENPYEEAYVFGNPSSL